MQCGSIRNRELLNYFLVFLGFCFLTKLIISGAYFNDYDTYWYRQWVFDIQQNGLFTVYSRAEGIALDYPPFYLFFLYVTGLMYKAVGNNCSEFLQMLLMKFWPIVFDILCAALLYFIFSKKGKNNTGFIAAALWLCNPSVMFNTCIWGQTDQVMCFLLLLSFYAFCEKKPVLACALFAVAGLTKYQCLFFTPILLLAIIRDYNSKKLALGVGAAAATVATVFLPFMIGAKNPLLFFDVYLGGAGKYDYCTLNAFNIYGIFKLNWVRDSISVLGIPLSLLSVVFVILSIFLIIYLFVFGKRTCMWVGGLLFMQCLFMLTTRMHERYQVVVLPFALMAYFVHKEKGFLWLFAALSTITAINQAFVLLPINAHDVLNSTTFWSNTVVYDNLLSVFSIINTAIFVWSVYLCVKFFAREEIKNDFC